MEHNIISWQVNSGYQIVKYDEKKLTEALKLLKRNILRKRWKNLLEQNYFQNNFMIH